MELNCNRSIKFVNILDNESFTFSLILVKGYITSDSGKFDASGTIVTYYLDADSNVSNQVFSPVQGGKFIILLNLELGKNDFSFQFEQNETKKTFFYIRPASEYVVTPVYIICEETDSSNNYAEEYIEVIKGQILVGCRLIQTLIAETLYQYGFEKKTFTLEQDFTSKSESCLIFYTKLRSDEISTMTSEGLWEFFGREIMTSDYGSQNRKYLAFLSCGKNQFSKNLAIGGGGLALCGAEYVKSWPTSVDKIYSCFVNDTDFILTDNSIKNTYESCFSAALGAVCHELCHTFDLGHTINGIMGRDFDRINVIFSISKCQNIYREMEKSQKFNCIKSKKDSLIICEGTFCRRLNINYTINKKNINQTDNSSNDVNNVNKLFPRVLFWSDGCATLLAYHRWINPTNNSSIERSSNSSFDERILRFDDVRSIVTSEYGIVVVQLRNENGYILKSWEFLERRKKTLFLVPICEARKACLIVVEDIKGNLLKKDIENLHY